MVLCAIRKSIFAVNLPLKLFPATIVNADIGSLLKSHHMYSLKSGGSICQWNLNKIVWVKLHEILSFLTKPVVFITIFVSPELCSERDYVVTHSVCSMYVVCTWYVCGMWYFFAKLTTLSTYIDVFPWDLDTMIHG